MHLGKSIIGVLSAVALALSVGGPAGGSAAAGQELPGAGAAGAAVSSGQRITLITGDLVLITDPARGGITVRPGPGRERLTFLTQRVTGHTYVLPADALPLVVGGRLDRRLFDITALAQFGYDDLRRDDIPLIVQYAKPAQRQDARRTLSATGSVVAGDLPAARGLTVRQAKGDTAAFWRTIVARDGARTLAAGLDRIWLDGKRRIQINESVPQVGAPAAWDAGITGAGVTVAVLDTGIDSSHPDLAGKVVAERNFSEAATADDEVGHGTHVASIITGSGSASAGAYRGMAPDVRLLNGRVCESEWCTESAILGGLQWAAADQRARVVNFSIGGPDTPQVDPVEEAVNTLTALYGTLFVVSAGNDGPGRATISSPGSADAALTVGAVTKAGEVAGFSSRGPRVGDGAIKPDIAAPGVDIVAARARNGFIGDPVENPSYCSLSGTSMAAPHVTGAAALLASAHPDWGPARLKAALMVSADRLPADLNSVGTGRLAVGNAINLRVVAEPGSLSMGIQLWPHSDDQPVTRTITYVNTGDSTATVALGIELSGPYGKPVPAGMFTLSANQLTVPAGGSQQVVLTANTRGRPTPGAYFGWVDASVNGEPGLQTPFALEVEAERYAVTLRHTDVAGSAASSYFSYLLRRDTPDERYVGGPSPTVTLRLPRATYQLMSVITTDPDTAGQRQSLLVYPLLKVNRNIAVNLNASRARPVRLTVPDRKATSAAVSVGYDSRLNWTDSTWQVMDPTGRITSVGLGPMPPKSVFVGRVEAVLSRPGAVAPNRYNLGWYLPGSFPTGFSRAVKATELAKVNQTYLAPTEGLVGEMMDVPFPTVNKWISSGWLYVEQTFPLPATGTEYYLVRDVRWQQMILQHDAEWSRFNTQSSLRPIAYRAGRTYQARWNGAVVGPSALGDPVVRDLTFLAAGVSMLSDGTPGHVGSGSYDSGRTLLYRNGQKIAENAEPGWIWAEVSMEVAQYRLSTELVRTADTSTRISAAWTFESGFTGEGPSVVPIMALRFSPAVNRANTAPAGRQFTIPIRVEGAVGGVKALAVQVSYDGGVTWRKATVTKSGGVWQARVTHPAGAGHVALRAQATDGKGNTVQETIIRAYHIR